MKTLNIYFKFSKWICIQEVFINFNPIILLPVSKYIKLILVNINYIISQYTYLQAACSIQATQLLEPSNNYLSS